MKVRLLHRDRDVDLERPLPAWSESLVQDLGLDVLLDAMGGGSSHVRQVAAHELLDSLETPDEIRYRQGILSDFLAAPDLARRLYELAVEGVEAPKQLRFFWARDSADTQLSKALRMLELLVGLLERLRAAADEHADAARSEGLATFLGALRGELDDDYLGEVRAHLQELRFRDGALISAELGPGNRGTGYVLRRERGRGLLGRLAPDWASGMSFSVSPRDEFGMRALSELRDRGIAHSANALAQSTDHILGFFRILRDEVGFYVACLNLSERLAEQGVSTVLPQPADAEEDALTARQLVDTPLALELGSRVVGSDLDADGAPLLIVTGANEGGKSTFLRSLGVAQLLLQAGSLVTAGELRASVRSGVFTHFKREEDVEMASGKLDEELRRMNEIAGTIAPHALLLCNESFASTNEAEGSEIARQVVRALVEERVRVAYVTHLYDLAHSLHEERPGNPVFLRAERRPDGERTFRMVPGEPEPTSYGADSYRRIFGVSPAQASRAS